MILFCETSSHVRWMSSNNKEKNSDEVKELLMVLTYIVYNHVRSVSLHNKEKNIDEGKSFRFSVGPVINS